MKNPSGSPAGMPTTTPEEDRYANEDANGLNFATMIFAAPSFRPQADDSNASREETQ
jgi:hypothetical protein